MRASELIGSKVFDADGRCAGVVRDIHLDPDRAADGSFEILGLLVSAEGKRPAAAHDWGFAAGRADGPALLRRLFGAARQRPRFVPVDWVLDWNPRHLKIGGLVDEPR